MLSMKTSESLRNKFIIDLFKTNIFPSIIFVFCILLTGIFRPLGAWYLKIITNSIISDGTTYLLSMIIIVCLIQVVNYSTKFIAGFVCWKLAKQLSLNIRISILKHIHYMPFINFEKYKSGELQSIIYNDSDVAGNTVYTVFSRLGTSFITALFTLIIMGMMDWKITMFVVTISIVFSVINQRFLLNIKKHNKVSRTALGDITNSVVNSCETIDTIRAYNAQDYKIGWFKKQRSIYNDAMMNISKIDGTRLSLYDVVNNFALFGSILYMANRATAGNESLGDVVAYMSLLTQALISIEMVFRWMSRLATNNAAWDRVHQIVADGDESTILYEQAPITVNKLELKSINFGYEADKKILNNYSVMFEKGNVYGISGGSGSGKSTLLKCILGLYDKNDADFVLNGKQEDKLLLHSLFSFVPADNFMFTGTIYENITMGKTDITEEMCMKYAMELGIGDWINTLPNKLNSEVQEGGCNFSGGQRQMLCILRALLSEKPIIVLDEPFSALDNERELSLQNILEKIKENKIVILTSHRANTMKCCDKILEI